MIDCTYTIRLLIIYEIIALKLIHVGGWLDWIYIIYEILRKILEM